MNCAEKNIRANNLLQFIHQFTIHHRIQVPKVLVAREISVQFGIKYQIMVSSIKFRTCFAKFMILIALFKKFLSKNLLRVLKSATLLDALAKRKS